MTAKTGAAPRRGRDALGRFVTVGRVPCSVSGCHNVAEKRGWCGGHYFRWRTKGDVLADIPLRRIGDRESQIMGKVQKDIESGHWYWTGYIDKQTGYGTVNLDGRGTGPTTAHRAVYELLVGPIPPGDEPDHVCRVRHCVNVLDDQHVELVTGAENRRRAVKVREENRRRKAASHA